MTNLNDQYDHYTRLAEEAQNERDRAEIEACMAAHPAGELDAREISDNRVYLGIERRRDNRGRFARTETGTIRRSVAIIVTGAATLLLAAGMMSVGASVGLPSQSPGDNFNMTVPPAAVVAPEPAPVAVQAPAPTVTHHNTPQTVKAATVAPSAPQAVTPEPTTSTTVASLPACPTDGTAFPYGTCTVPAGIKDPHDAKDGAPAKIGDPAGCGLAVIPASYPVPLPGAYTCQ